MEPAAGSWMARSVMILEAGRPAVGKSVRAHVAPVLSNRETTWKVAANSRVPLANSTELTRPASRSWFVAGPPAATYGFVLVGSVAHVVPQSAVTQTRLV